MVPIRLIDFSELSPVLFCLTESTGFKYDYVISLVHSITEKDIVRIDLGQTFVHVILWFL